MLEIDDALLQCPVGAERSCWVKDENDISVIPLRVLRLQSRAASRREWRGGQFLPRDAYTSVVLAVEL